ncbi:MAG: Acetate kinase [Chroococcopsis gigantea SAG 12.99]|jgi:acetate kinase|nr:Acetate kinase [Chroococcopsis gigantea SAG 12.99]
MKILVLNAGSSSQKSCLYSIPDDSVPAHPPEPIWQADIDFTVNDEHGILTVKANGMEREITVPGENRSQGITIMVNTLIEGDTRVLNHLSEINCVGHRVVHGGSNYSQSVIVTPEVKSSIRELIPLAPAHNGANLEGIEVMENSLPNVPQVAVFDTAFHRTIPPESSTYPLPREWWEKGIKRYGFHGTSHKYCAGKAAEILDKPLDSLRMIICHLGNGASLCAVKNGESIDTTMGFTPLEGLMMGSRSGSLDPAILIYLMRNHGFTADELDRLLNKESGLKGVSGISADMRAITTAMNEGDSRARLALDMYIHRLRGCMGSMIASLEGLDVLVFTAGIGENAPSIREKACEGWNFLGLKIDGDKNRSHPRNIDIATTDSPVRILVIHTEEDWTIARDCIELLKGKV